MTKQTQNRIKVSIKHLLGRFVYACVYSKNNLKKIRTTLIPNITRHNFVTLTSKKWKIFILIAIFFLGFYYGLGAFISSKINNNTNVEIKKTIANGKNVPNALAFVLKTQVDQEAWTPALPLIFPAAILDNLPNFQLGAKDSVYFFIKQLSNKYPNSNLKNATTLLDYPPDIWLFSQTKDEKISPGSAKQYRKALAEIDKFINNPLPLEIDATNDLNYLLKSTDTLLNKLIANLNKHIQEHNSELADLRADDIFYKTQGSIYTLYYFLEGILKDYQTEILEIDQYENITSTLKILEDALNLRPLSVKNASLDDTYAANHLAYLVNFLAQAQNKIQQIYYHNLLKKEGLSDEI